MNDYIFSGGQGWWLIEDPLPPPWTVSAFTPLQSNFNWDSLMTPFTSTTPLQGYFTVTNPHSIHHPCSPSKILIVCIPTILLSRQKVVKCDKSKIQSCNPSLHKRSVMPPVSRCGNHNLRVISIAALSIADRCHLGFCSSWLPWGFIEDKCPDQQKQESFSFRKS